MKKLMMATLCVGVSFLSMSHVRADEDATALEDANVGNKRIHCQGSSPLDPYVDIRGNLSITGNAPYYKATGNLAITLGGGTPPRTFSLSGQYFVSGKMEFASLLPLNPGSSTLDEVYIDFKDTTNFGQSYLATTQGTFRMYCPPQED